MKTIMNSIAMILLIVSLTPSFAFAAPTYDVHPSPEKASYTASWFVRLSDNVLMEMGRVQLDDTYMSEDGSFDMDRIKALFRIEETAIAQGLTGKQAMISIFDDICSSAECEVEMADDCFSETGSAQCIGNPVEEGMCVFTLEQHKQSICHGCSRSCDSFEL